MAMDFMEFAKIVENNNGNAYFVGGKIRDMFMGRESHDTDICVTGLTQDKFIELFPDAKMTGISFPVYRMEINGEKVEVAFARREKKIAEGHNGFTVEFSSSVTIEDDLYRRDLTMNAMAIHILSGDIIDPYNGKADIKNKLVKHVSEHFKDDPLRALRAARQAAVFGFSIADETYDMMNQCKEELKTMSKERIFGELEKALKSDKPSMFFRHLNKADILDVVFPHIFKLIGKTQPVDFHPEGDAFEHTMIVLDTVAEKTDDLKIRFAGLMHDIGKGETPEEMLPHHYQHDKVGAEIVLNLPYVYYNKWKKVAALIAARHMAAHGMKKFPKILKLFENMKRINLMPHEFELVILADNGEKHWWLDDDVFNEVMNMKMDIPAHKTGEAIKNFVFNARLNKLTEIYNERNH